MDSPFKSMCLFAVFGVVGIVGALGIIGPTRIEKPFWFQPPAQQQVIANEQQDSTGGQVTGDPEHATPATGSILSRGEWQTGVREITIQPDSQAIERLKAGLDELDQLLQARKALESKVAHLNHLLEEKTRALSTGEEAETGKLHELERKNMIQTEEIKRLQAKLEKQDQLLLEKTAKLVSLKHAAEQRNGEKEEKIARLETEVAHLNRILDENTTALSSAGEAATNREQLTSDLSATNQRQREEIRQVKTAPRTSTDSEQTDTLLPPTIVNNAERISVAEVADMVKSLNAQIEQGSSLISDSLFDQESSSTGKEREIVWDELNDFIGSWLCNDLMRRSKELNVEPHPLITPITLQTGLVNVCSRIINDWNPPFWIDDLIFSRTISSIEKANGQATADAWEVLLRSHVPVFPSERQAANKRHLTEVLLKLITAVGGSLESGILPPQYDEVLEDIVKESLKLRTVVSEDLVPMMELATDTVPCDAEFDPSQMVDTERTGSGRVVCTVEMGLRYRKRGRLRKKSEEWGVRMKSKVVLATTLED